MMKLLQREDEEISCLKDQTNDLINLNDNLQRAERDSTEEAAESQREPEINVREHIPTFGDQKTCSNVRSVRNRAPDEYKSFTECPGDFHAMGYVMKAIVSIYGASGMYYVCRGIRTKIPRTRQVLKRKKVTPKSSKKIFNEGNFERNFDVLYDYFWGVGLALVKEFQASEFFPSDKIAAEVTKTSGNCNQLLLLRFRDWIKECSKADTVFLHHARSITSELPILKFFHESIRNGNGASLEAVWMELVPLFAGTNRRNYKDEAFVHVTNLVARWPKAVCLMVWQNKTISIKGKTGHNFANDEFVEMCLVKPTKRFAKRQKTLVMLENF